MCRQVAQQKEMVQSGRRFSPSLTASSLPTLLRDSPTSAADKLLSQALQQQQQLLSSSQSQVQAQGSVSFSVDSSSSNNSARQASSDSILPLPSPIKTDLDTHAFFT